MLSWGGLAADKFGGRGYFVKSEVFVSVSGPLIKSASHWMARSWWMGGLHQGFFSYNTLRIEGFNDETSTVSKCRGSEASA